MTWTVSRMPAAARASESGLRGPGSGLSCGGQWRVDNKSEAQYGLEQEQ
jgi:hypothetical protein